MRSTLLALMSLVFVACAPTRAVDGPPRAPSRAVDEGPDLPLSTAELEASPRLVVTATKKALFLEGAPVAAITDGRVAPSLKSDGDKGFIIAPLVEALARRPGAATPTAERHDGPVALGIDGTLPYRLFTEIVFSCGQAGYRNFDLVVRQVAGGLPAAIPIAIPDTTTAHDPETTVWIDRSGFKLVVARAWVELPRLPDGRYDYASLQARLSAIKAAAGDGEHDTAVVSAEGSIPYAVVVATMDVMRVTRDRRPLFPVLQLAI